MKQEESVSKEGVLSKIFWIVFGAVITSILAVPVAYYIISPITPRANLVSSITGGLRGNDNKYVLIANLKNADSRVSAKDIIVSFGFDRNCIEFFDSHKSADARINSDVLCEKYNEEGNYCHSKKTFKCSIINPGEKREFIIYQDNHPSDIKLNTFIEGAKSEQIYKFCSRPNGVSGGSYQTGSVCPD